MFGSKGILRNSICAMLASMAVATFAAPAQAEMILSKIIVDLRPNSPSYDDIEVWNDGSERMYVLAETAEIVAPGTPQQRRVTIQDPSVSGLLVAPQRLVLEPGQRRVIRISAVAARQDADRIYRVTIKPVGGPVSSDNSALKVFIGYDALVIYRPKMVVGGISFRKESNRIIINNNSNTSYEIFDGKQCDPEGGDCVKLSPTRIYSGGTFEQEMPFDTVVEYSVSDGARTSIVKIDRSPYILNSK